MWLATAGTVHSRGSVEQRIGARAQTRSRQKSDFTVATMFNNTFATTGYNCTTTAFRSLSSGAARQVTSPIASPTKGVDGGMTVSVDPGGGVVEGVRRKRALASSSIDRDRSDREKFSWTRKEIFIRRL